MKMPPYRYSIRLFKVRGDLILFPVRAALERRAVFRKRHFDPPHMRIVEVPVNDRAAGEARRELYRFRARYA